MITFPPFLYTSAGINITLDEFAHWFQALLNGRMIQPITFETFWQAALLNNGKPSYRSYGWERREQNGIVKIGHGGGGHIH